MAHTLLISNPMKAIIISNDRELVNIIKNLKVIPENQLSIYSDKADALEIMSYVCTKHPSILLLDDDFVKPQTAQILNAIRKVNQKVKIVFFSSDPSIELGREVSPAGIHYHAIKPVDKTELNDLFTSIIN
jgi:two-component SAPR family response regulator